MCAPKSTCYWNGLTRLESELMGPGAASGRLKRYGNCPRGFDPIEMIATRGGFCCWSRPKVSPIGELCRRAGFGEKQVISSRKSIPRLPYGPEQYWGTCSTASQQCNVLCTYIHQQEPTWYHNGCAGWMGRASPRDKRWAVHTHAFTTVQVELCCYFLGARDNVLSTLHTAFRLEIIVYTGPYPPQILSYRVRSEKPAPTWMESVMYNNRRIASVHQSTTHVGGATRSNPTNGSVCKPSQPHQPLRASHEILGHKRHPISSIPYDKYPIRCSSLSPNRRSCFRRDKSVVETVRQIIVRRGGVLVSSTGSCYSCIVCSHAYIT